MIRATHPLARFPLVLPLAVVALGCDDRGAISAPAASADTAPLQASATADVDPAKAAVLRKVPPDEVCMMNNRFMKEKQIPVPVDGRMYYGCCAMCKDKLTNDASARTGTDPVSGRPVDKAVAVIGAKPSNAVVYFENQENFDAYVRAGGQLLPREAPATPASASAAPAAPASTAAPAKAPPAKAPPVEAPRAPSQPPPPAAPAAPQAPATPGHGGH